MTWSTAESLIIDKLTEQSAATAKNVNEIKEAIVGSLRNGGKPGIQDTVRELGANVGRLHGNFSEHKKADFKTHKRLRYAIVGLGLFTLIGVLLNFEAAGRLLELVIKWIT